ncbi:ERCC4 domain-containing protein [Anaerovoracaceae bacterium 41-7]
MIDKYYYTDKEIEKLCKSIEILVDTREKVNQHITDWFDKKSIPWRKKALKNGDYSFMVPKNLELNIERDLFFDKEIMIERKKDLDELAGNITTNRTRFEEEMATFSGKKYLLLEVSTYPDIVDGKYRSKLSNKSYMGTVHSFNHKYNLEVVYMPNQNYSGIWIYGTFFYYLKNMLR